MHVNLLNEGIEKGNNAICELLSYNLEKKGITNDNKDILKNLKNGEEIGLVIYNSNSWEAKEIISIVVNRDDLIIKDSDNKEIEIQYNAIPDYSVDKSQDSSYYLYFPVKVNAVGYSIYYISVGKSNKRNIGNIYNDTLSIENSKYELSLDEQTGHVDRKSVV